MKFGINAAWSLINTYLVFHVDKSTKSGDGVESYSVSWNGAVLRPYFQRGCSERGGPIVQRYDRSSYLGYWILREISSDAFFLQEVERRH